MKKHAPIHPGEVLREDFILPLGLSEYRLAHDIGVPPRRVNEIVKGKRSITADTALRLARWLGFRRTGKIIDESARSLINGLLREGSLEKDGQSWIRRA